MDLTINENLFLIVLAFVWITGAVIQDLRRREVDNIWNFSLIAFALAYRMFFSVYSSDYWFFINGVLGLLLFLLLGNILYYSRVFAGGDAKLLIALGAVLPLSYDWILNFRIFGLFVLLFFITGAFYVLIWSMVLVLFNWKGFRKEFSRQFSSYKKMSLVIFAVSIIWFLAGFFEFVFISVGFIFLLFPFLFIYSKSVEECCLVRLVNPHEVTEGDWLYKDVRAGKRLIKANWEGVSAKELVILKKSRKKVLVKYGVPFTPAFLFGLAGLIYILKNHLMGF